MPDINSPDSDRTAPWTVYILQCRDASYYTGITNDLARRISHHEQSTGAKYTRGRGPFTLVYQESCPDRSQASRREHALKKLSRREKQQLITVHAAEVTKNSET